MSHGRIRRGLGRLAGVVCLAASLAFTSPAAAQSSGRADSTGAALAHHFMLGADFKGFQISEMTRPEFAREVAGLDLQPGWEGLLREAVSEEIDHDLPALEQMIGREFDKALTPTEIQAAVEFLKSPSGRKFLAAMAADFTGKTPSPPTEQDVQEITAFFTSAEGTAFLAKFQELNTNLFDQSVMDELLPGVVQRYKAKLALKR